MWSNCTPNDTWRFSCQIILTYSLCFARSVDLFSIKYDPTQFTADKGQIYVRKAFGYTPFFTLNSKYTCLKENLEYEKENRNTELSSFNLDGRRQSQNNCTKELTTNKDEGEEALDDFLENGKYWIDDWISSQTFFL